MNKIPEILERLEKEMCTLAKKEPLQIPDVTMLKELAEAYSKLTTSVGVNEFSQNMYGDDMSMDSFRRGRSPLTGQFVSRGMMPMYDSYGNQGGGNSNTYAYGNQSMGQNSQAYNGGYSGHSINDRMIASLEHMMSQTNDQYEKEQIRNEIESIRRK